MNKYMKQKFCTVFFLKLFDNNYRIEKQKAKKTYTTKKKLRKIWKFLILFYTLIYFRNGNRNKFIIIQITCT